MEQISGKGFLWGQKGVNEDINSSTVHKIDAEAETRQLVDLLGSKKKDVTPKEKPPGSHVAPGGLCSPSPN